MEKELKMILLCLNEEIDFKVIMLHGGLSLNIFKDYIDHDKKIV